MRIRLIALASAALLIAPAAAQAQNPLSSIFSCNNPNNRQQGGAIAGALLGGLLGNQINDNDRTTGTVIGGLLGAAAGSAIGCNMSSSDTGRAVDATHQALDSGRSTTWRNASNGSSGRIDIVDTYRRGDVSAYDRYSDRRYDDRSDGRYSYRPTSLADVRFAYGVAQPGSNYRMSSDRYEARSRTNVRAAPTRNSQVLATLSPGESFDALATVGSNWLLVSRNDQAIGYVSADVVSRLGGYGSSYASNDRYQSSGELCRVFDQTVTRSGFNPTTQRFTACQSSGGEWVIQS